jgi:hypothetical protein
LGQLRIHHLTIEPCPQLVQNHCGQPLDYSQGKGKLDPLGLARLYGMKPGTEPAPDTNQVPCPVKFWMNVVQLPAISFRRPEPFVRATGGVDRGFPLLDGISDRFRFFSGFGW